MNMGILESFVAGRSKADERLLKMLFRDAESGAEWIRFQLEKISESITEGELKTAGEQLDSLRSDLNERFPSTNEQPEEKGGDTNITWRRYSIRTGPIGMILKFPDSSVESAVIRLLKEYLSDYIRGDGEDYLRSLGFLLHCFRRKDGDDALKQVREVIRDILVNQQPILKSSEHLKFQIRLVTLLSRAYFGISETGGWLPAIYCGIAEKNNWVMDMVLTYKALYINPAMHQNIKVLAKSLASIVNSRVKETKYPNKEGRKHPSLFSINECESLNTLLRSLQQS